MPSLPFLAVHQFSSIRGHKLGRFALSRLPLGRVIAMPDYGCEEVHRAQPDPDKRQFRIFLGKLPGVVRVLVPALRGVDVPANGVLFVELGSRYSIRILRAAEYIFLDYANVGESIVVHIGEQKMRHPGSETS